MKTETTYIKTLGKVEAKLSRMKEQAAAVRWFYENGNLPESYNRALRLEELSEQTVLLTRVLPAYTGAAGATVQTDAIISDTIPVEVGFTAEGWFSVRIPALLPKKASGSADYIRSYLYPAMRKFFDGKPPVRFRDCVLAYRHVYDRSRPERAMRDHDNTILGEYNGKAVCMPEDTRLNRHIAVFGASGTMKSRAIIRNALFQALRRSESVIVTDSKGELYADTSEMFRKAGYDVKIYNLVSPEHSDSWNCMSDLNGDTLMAQVLTNVIIGNTSSGKGDHFWDNGEGNLLKALILLIDQDRTRSPDMKHLSAVYQLLTQNSERQLTAMFDKLPLDHPARAPFNLFAQSSDTVRSGIILGLGTRLQVLQNQAVQRITSRSDIDLTAPGRNKCIYYIVLSDQDATMAFLSSLFFSFMFIKLTRYADGRPNGRCDVPVNLILDEFNNVGRIGGAEDGSDFARSLSVVRSRDIRVMLAVQSLGQLQNRYPKNLWAEIIGNCDIQLMLGCTDDVSAEYISARSGDMSVQVNSTMTVRQTIAVAQVIPQYRHTEGQGRRRLLTPDEVLRLPNEELLCIIRGHNILKLNKLDFTKHPMAKQIVKASVYDYQPAADTMIPEPIRSDTEPAPPKKATRRKSLYSSAQPPSEF